MKKKVVSIILIVLSLPVNILAAMINTSDSSIEYASEKAGYFVGGIMAPYIISVLLSLIIYIIRKKANKQPLFIFIFSICVLIISILILMGHTHY